MSKHSFTKKKWAIDPTKQDFMGDLIIAFPILSSERALNKSNLAKILSLRNRVQWQTTRPAMVSLKS